MVGREAKSEVPPLWLSLDLFTTGCYVAQSNPLLPRCALNVLLQRYRLLSASRGQSTACALLLALVSVATAAAQTLKTSGTLEGTISDSTGGRIPGVKVSLRQTETNQIRTVYTDDQGFFRSTDLSVGTYEVRIENPGFAPSCIPELGSTWVLPHTWMSSFQWPA